MGRPKTAPAFRRDDGSDGGGCASDFEKEYLPWECSDLFAILGLRPEGVMFYANQELLVDAHEKSLYYTNAKPAVSVDTAMRFFRERYGIALNVNAHDGNFYTVEPVYLDNAAEGFQAKFDEVEDKYPTYEQAAHEGICTLLLELLECKVQGFLPGARIIKVDELKRIFDQNRRDNIPIRPKQ